MTTTNQDTQTFSNLAFCRWADGLMLTAEQLGVDDLEKVYGEQVLNKVGDMANEDGIKWESCREGPNSTFHFDGDVYQWRIEEEWGVNGEDVILIECEEVGWQEED